MFFKRRTDAASAKAAQPSTSAATGKVDAKADPKAGKQAKKADKRAAKAGAKAASQVTGKVGVADKLAAARAAAAHANDGGSTKRSWPWSGRKSATAKASAPVPATAPGQKPAWYDLSEWSLRRKVALVLAVPVILAGAFGGLRVRSEMSQADNYAASASQVTVLGPAVDYLAAAENAAVVARTVGINDPQLDAAQQEVVEAGARLVDARDKADL